MFASATFDPMRSNFRCCRSASGLAESVRREGYRLRLYVPYGGAWYPYFMRRLAERPANVLFVAKSLLR